MHVSPKIRFATYEDIQWFEKTIRRVAEEELTERVNEWMAGDRFYVDFMR
jgi:hypothetical protein